MIVYLRKFPACKILFIADCNLHIDASIKSSLSYSLPASTLLFNCGMKRSMIYNPRLAATCSDCKLPVDLLPWYILPIVDVIATAKTRSHANSPCKKYDINALYIHCIIFDPVCVTLAVKQKHQQHVCLAICFISHIISEQTTSEIYAAGPLNYAWLIHIFS